MKEMHYEIITPIIKFHPKICQYFHLDVDGEYVWWQVFLHLVGLSDTLIFLMNGFNIAKILCLGDFKTC